MQRWPSDIGGIWVSDGSGSGRSCCGGTTVAAAATVRGTTMAAVVLVIPPAYIGEGHSIECHCSSVSRDSGSVTWDGDSSSSNAGSGINGGGGLT